MLLGRWILVEALWRPIVVRLVVWRPATSETARIAVALLLPLLAATTSETARISIALLLPLLAAPAVLTVALLADIASQGTLRCKDGVEATLPPIHLLWRRSPTAP